MDQAQHPRGTPDDTRLDINDTHQADSVESAKSGGTGITQGRNSQDGAPAGVGDGIAGSSIQRTNTTCVEEANDADTVPAEMTDAERQIRHLLAIKGLQATRVNMCQVALDEWQSTADFFGKRVDRRNEEVRSIRNEIYQVVGFFSAFQGLLITAVAQSSLLQCRNVGFPLALSAFATAAAVIGMGQKNRNILELKRTIRSETPTRKTLANRVIELKQQGTGFDFQRIEDATRTKKKKFNTSWPLYETGIVISLVVFGALCMAAMHQILCNPGRSNLNT